MIQRSRKPALVVLLATFVAGAAYVSSTTTDSRVSDGPTLVQLEIAIGDADATAETWLLYAQRLQQAGRLTHAAAAYQRVLEADPCSHLANLQCAVVIAQTGDADRFHEFMSKLLLVDPRLTQDVFGRPEVQRYLSAERFQTLLAQARIQSMD
ncbi:MAG: tetratricopeptide repeat protein [Verrucomicrobiota bacterium]